MSNDNKENRNRSWAGGRKRGGGERGGSGGGGRGGGGRLKCFRNDVHRFRSDSRWVYALTVITQSENEQRRAARAGFICVIGRLRENIVVSRAETYPHLSRVYFRARVYSRAFSFFASPPFFPISLFSLVSVAFFLSVLIECASAAKTDVDKVITTEIKCADK